ncbi:MAG: nitroreductase family protein [Cytophagaceae bacterium]|jgi:nitroreductase/dihydropteridine reductase|nr:nitroreductase family protein [Cytophagaceae bacterium]
MKKQKLELAKVSYFNEQKINDASHLVVFNAITSIEKFEEQIKKNLPEGSVNYYMNFIKPLPESEIKAWLKHQVYLSLGFFLAACASMEIDSTPMEGIKSEEYSRILGLHDYQAVFAVAIGYRHPEDSNQPAMKPKARLNVESIIQEL